MVVEGMPETAEGGGVMLSRRRGKARRRKRKELFAIQMCFAAVLLGLVVGLQTVAQKAGEEQSGGFLSHSVPQKNTTFKLCLQSARPTG